MIHLGQSLWYTPMASKDKQPAIYIGKNEAKGLVLLTENLQREIVEVATTLTTLSPIRQINDQSPTGKSIYYGTYCKYIGGDHKIKPPSDELLWQELDVIKKHK